MLKRGINGVYHSVSEKWLQNYINEYGFRFNHRKDERPLLRQLWGSFRLIYLASYFLSISDKVSFGEYLMPIVYCLH